MRALVLSLVLLLSLAGCTGPGTDPAATDGPAQPPPGTDPKAWAGTFVPWELSDYWAFNLDARNFDGYDSTRLLYYDEAGEEYTVGAPNYDEALYHAVYDFNPLLGRIHSNLLSPHERGEHTFMFPFHRSEVIQDGDEWTTSFFGHVVTVRSAYAEDVPSPLGPRPGFVFTATDANDATFSAEYSYVRDVKWFTYLNVADAEGPFVDLRLAEHGTGGTGPAYFIRGKDYLDASLHADGAVPSVASFTVSEADVDDRRVESLAIAAHIDMQSGVGATLRLRAPDGSTIWQSQPTSADGAMPVQEVWPTGAKSSAPLEERPQWPAGTYTVELSIAGQASAEVRIVGTQDNSGSL